uniref:ral GTPase-activating protein subunit beta isoform X3 n=1 Tax=Myxine glutinosa TaxID=7769 RepID=UPI00358DE290
MYSEWRSLHSVLDRDRGHLSVLHCYPETCARDVVAAVVRPLGQAPWPSNPECLLQTDKQVKWTMEVLGFGLTLPLDGDVVKRCVDVYMEWLNAISDLHNTLVPLPVRQQPNSYARCLLKHLYNLFVPRGNGSVDRQVDLCRSVLSSLQHLARGLGDSLERETWEGLLVFLLRVSDTLLAPPTQHGGLADLLAERLVAVLLEVWLAACSHCFPTPPYWRTARELISTWRHHPAVVTQWNRISAVLTSRLLQQLYGMSLPSLRVPEDDLALIPANMTEECLAQSWFRFLHMIGNPVDLANPAIVASAPRFQEALMECGGVPPDASRFHCLRHLPAIFHSAMCGVSQLVDAFLGVSRTRLENTSSVPVNTNRMSAPFGVTSSSSSGGTTTSPHTRRARAVTVSKTVARTVTAATIQVTAAVPHSSRSSSATPQEKTSSNLHAPVAPSPLVNFDPRPSPAPGRSQVNSILNLFGQWLFEAALVNCRPDTPFVSGQPAQAPDPRRKPSQLPVESGGGAGVAGVSVGSSISSSLPAEGGIGGEWRENFEAGRAEACGTLSCIMASKKTGEEILPVYLARFYFVIAQGLQVSERHVLAAIILNSPSLFCSDLKGINTLAPYFISALEHILPDRDLHKFKMFANPTDLRRASIHILLTLLPLPLHFGALRIEPLLDHRLLEEGIAPPSTFRALKLRLVNLLIGALQTECDSANTQMILGAMLYMVQDSALLEKAVSQADGQEASQTQNRDGSVSSTGSSESVTPDSEKSGPALMRDYGSSPPADSAPGLLMRAIHLVTQRLQVQWKSDLIASLAALELLAGLAKVRVPVDPAEQRHAVSAVCEFIVSQCRRPAPYHSRDLHSMIVAAFSCLCVWLTEHPTLLDEKNCLWEVLEIVELGVSGAKSRVGPGSTVTLKGEKEQAPASLRVREAAEATLTCIMQNLGSFPPPSGAASPCSLLNEDRLIAFIQSRKASSEPASSDPLLHFRFFALDNSVLLSILEQPLGLQTEKSPSVTLVLRGAGGRHVWTMQLQQQPRDSPLVDKPFETENRPTPRPPAGPRPTIRHRVFPDEVDKIPFVKADCSIPDLPDIVDEQLAIQHEKLRRLLDVQIAYETGVVATLDRARASTPFPDPQLDCRPPGPAPASQTARLLLSHLGLLSFEALKEPSNSRLPPSLVALEPTLPGFRQDLAALDSLPTRPCDTVFVFYVRAGQTQAAQILSNVEKASTVQGAFLELLLSLGWPVVLGQHPGWSGHVATSWQTAEDVGTSFPSETNGDPLEGSGGAVFNGERKVLYFADALTEVAFVVPTASQNGGRDFVLGEEDTGRGTLRQPSSTTTCDTQAENMAGAEAWARRATAVGKALPSLGPETKVLVVWVESYDDIEHFPITELLAVTGTGLEGLPGSTTSVRSSCSERDVPVVFMQPLATGLFRVRLAGPAARLAMATPLVDGMVVTRRALGLLVRQTAVNACRRRRLESDLHSPPHVRRKVKITDLIHKHRSRLLEPDFFASLFYPTLG